MDKYDIGIFIFRRDLRLYDNLGFIEFSKKCNQIIPIFLLDKKQIKLNSKNKKYFSNNAVQFICESLEDFNDEFKTKGSRLFMFMGTPAKNVDKLISSLKKQFDTIAVGFNIDFSPYAEKRDKAIQDVCHTKKVDCLTYEDDYTLVPFNLLVREENTGFKQYGAFYKHAIQHKVPEPKKTLYNDFYSGTKHFTFEYKVSDLQKLYKFNEHLAQNGGRTNALKRLAKLDKFKEYNTKRDILSYNTTNLSAYINMGCVSVRETYHKMKDALGPHTILLKQMYWRDFYLVAYRYLDNAKSFKGFMDPRYDKIKWVNNKKDWTTLINAKTGFLLVDAGMNEMKNTGFLHNRLRMILCVYWTKYLLINTFHPYGSQAGYSKYLVDAIGPSQNKMNHHWAVDFDYPGKKFSAPGAPLSGRPMDISNKMIKKWDPTCAYIKKWLPHLKDVDNKDIYNWSDKISEKYKGIHPAPLFDHREKYKEWIEACRKVKS